MIKVISLVCRKKRLNPEAFSDYWLNVHTPLASRIPGLKGFRVNVVLSPGDPVPDGYDGMAEMWFENRRTYRRALKSAEWQAVREDGMSFVANSEEYVTREHVILPGK